MNDLKNAIVQVQDDLGKLTDTQFMLIIAEASGLCRSNDETERAHGELLDLQCKREAYNRGWIPACGLDD